MGNRKSRPSSSSPGKSVKRIIQQKENEIKRQQQAYEELSAHNRALQQKIDDASQTTNENYEKTKADLEALKKSQKNLDQQKMELDHTRNILTKLNNENSKYLEELEDQRRKMSNLEEINRKALSEISQLNASNTVINKKLAEHQEKYEKDMKKIEEEHEKFMKQKEKELDLSKKQSAAILKTLNNERRKHAYDIRFAKSEKLKKHLDQYPQSFNVQIIGERGVGKSSLINYLVRKKLNLKNVQKAKTGTTETTINTTFFDVTEAFENVLTSDTSHVFFVDQPGIGGAKINRNC